MVIIFASPLNFCKTVKEQFENLKSLELNALTEKEHRDIHHKFEQLALEDPDAFEEALLQEIQKLVNSAYQRNVG